MSARIQVPRDVKRGEVIQVRFLIQHDMETGYRFDDRGTSIPRNVIHTINCTYNGREVMRAQTSSGIAANPYLQFPLRVAESGEFVLTWVDDLGVRGSERQSITVSG
ncbi:MAG: thiosulfate oxidation carrier complex protein SoxZ [Betaproteobacteria bacterium]|nr:thiosulfate oxidation carrier complex protein SoxZ [Betaproteobacteria bacterium]